jgi:hypothetical protein
MKKVMKIYVGVTFILTIAFLATIAGLLMYFTSILSFT